MVEGKPEVVRTKEAGWLKKVVEACKGGRAANIIDDALIGLKRDELPEGISLYLTREEILVKLPRPWRKTVLGLVLLILGASAGQGLTTLSRTMPDVGFWIQLTFASVCAFGLLFGTSLLVEALEELSERSAAQGLLTPRWQVVFLLFLTPIVGWLVGGSVLLARIFEHSDGLFAFTLTIVWSPFAKALVHKVNLIQKKLGSRRFGGG